MQKPLRIISKLENKGLNLIKGISFDGHRVLGQTHLFAKKYYEEGIDELIYLDTVASLYDRPVLDDNIKKACQSFFIPSSCGGGVKTLKKIENLLKSGADKVLINSYATHNPKFINEASKIFGSQCISIGIDAFFRNNFYEIWIDYGRERTNLNIIDWIRKIQDLGAGEIILSSINNDGTGKGFDFRLIELVIDNIKTPLVFGGGCGNVEHVISLIKNFPQLSGISISSALHYKYYENIFDSKYYSEYENRNINFDIGNTEFIKNNSVYPKIVEGFSIKELKKKLKKFNISVR